ncbi:hypothetical protein pb186bvf_011536 [Paramecium bursaria]
MTTVQEVQKELLEKLYEIREEFNQQLQKVQTQDVNLLYDLQNNADVVELKDKVRRLEYRVEHLQQGFDLLQESERKLLSENALLREQLANK